MTVAKNGLLAQDLIRLKNLQLAGRLVSDELTLGIHSSRRSGIGIEFEQYRHYEPGDDPKRIDWKLFARTGKHLIRESAAESNRKLRFVLDLSGSMDYEERGVSRLDYARLLIASLTFLGYRQNDYMSLYAMRDNRVVSLVPEGSGPSARQVFQRMLVALENATAGGSWSYGDSSKRFPEFVSGGREQMIIVSDLLQVNDEWLNLIRSLANPRREIVIFQLLGDDELEFNLEGFVRFVDLESGRTVELDAKSAREHIQQQSQAFFTRLAHELDMPHIQLVRVRLSDPPAAVLKQFLTNQKRT